MATIIPFPPRYPEPPRTRSLRASAGAAVAIVTAALGFWALLILGAMRALGGLL